MTARSLVGLLALLALYSLALPRRAQGDEVVAAGAHGADEEIDWAGHFSKAYRAAKRGDPKGFDGLLAIEEAGVSAEYSEVSLETLQCLLLSDARSWLRAMGKIDASSLLSGEATERARRALATSSLAFDGG